MQAARLRKTAGYLALAAAVLGIVAWVARSLAPGSAPGLCEALARRRVVEVFSVGDLPLRCADLRVHGASERLLRAVRANDGAGVAAELRATKASAVAVAPAASGSSLSRGSFVAGLRAVALAPEVFVYAPARELELSFEEREALAYVARALLRGAREPNVASFPPRLRRVERVEVIVMLSRRGEPRLWRSARATSIARALLTATRVARERWREREQSMGGPLSKRLLDLDVEVSLLSEDGTLVSTQRAFLNEAVGPEHGIGFDYRTSWHYVLPRDIPKGGGAYAALTAQLQEQGLTIGALSGDARVYRYVPIPLGVSRSPLATANVP